MSKPTLWIFADWDETVTIHDTLKLIAPPDSFGPDAPPPFSFFVDCYLALLSEHNQSFGPRDSLERELQYLDSLGSVETASIRKVEEYGLFRGVREVDIRERAQKVEFRNGWKEFTEQAMKQTDVQLMGIISVNWSRVFIESALRRIHDDAFIEQLDIRSNVLRSRSNYLADDRNWKWILRERERGAFTKESRVGFVRHMTNSGK